MKLARTIADLAMCDEIQPVHLAEALHAARSPEVDDGLIVYGVISNGATYTAVVMAK